MSIIVTEEVSCKNQVEMTRHAFKNHIYPKNVADFREKNSIKYKNYIIFVLIIVTDAQGFWLIKKVLVTLP